MNEGSDHILLVDDDRQLLSLLGDYLQACGLRVSQAENVAQARQCMARHRIDLLVLDVMLP